MGERMFWTDEKDEGSEEFERSHASDEDSNSKRLRLSPDFQLHPHQEGNTTDTTPQSSSSSPLGLTLTKTPSFLRLLQHSLFKGEKPKPSDSRSQPMSEKLKASNFPATSIQIGTWQRISRHEGELVAKLYYAKRKLVWEVLDRALKSKVEMQWSDIMAIRAATPPDEPGTLEIELSRPPLFYRESSPQPRTHTLWHQTADFTGGQAPILRRHYVRFPPGILDRHYNKLLQCDDRLAALSRKPFPSCESPYFDWNMCRTIPQHPYGTYPGETSRPLSYLELVPNSAISTGMIAGMDLTLGDEGGSSQFADQDEITSWGNLSQGLSQIPPSRQPNEGWSLNKLVRESPSGHGRSLNAPVYPFQESAAAVSPNYNVYNHCSITVNPLGHYSDNANWFAPQESIVTMNMNPNVDNSSGRPPFPGNPYNLGYNN